MAKQVEKPILEQFYHGELYPSQDIDTIIVKGKEKELSDKIAPEEEYFQKVTAKLDCEKHFQTLSDMHMEYVEIGCKEGFFYGFGLAATMMAKALATSSENMAAAKDAILKQFHEEKPYPPQGIVPNTDEYKEIVDQFASAQQHLKKALSEDDYNRLELLCDLYLNDATCFTIWGYVHGFELSAQMMAEGFEKNKQHNKTE